MIMNSKIIELIDQQRVQNNYLSISETMKLVESGNKIFDPFSTLISVFATIGMSNIFYPNSILGCDEKGELRIGNGNTFYPQSLLESSSGSIFIEDNNQFGEGGFTAKADRPGSIITIGSGGRYTSGTQLFGNNSLGSGSQIHGLITVINCTLAKGKPFTHEDPDLRAGVLKGSGSAKNLTVGVGEVIAGNGAFKQSDIKKQTFYHPKK